MGVIIKQSAYASVINYLGVVIGAANMIFLFPEILSIEQLGLYKALISMAIILSPFAQMGLARTTLRYFPRFKKSTKAAGRFFSFVLLLGSLTILIFIGLFQIIDQWVFGFFEENAPELIHQYWLIISLASIMVYISILEGYYKAQLNIVIPTFMREFFLRIAASLLAVLYFLRYISFAGFLQWTVLVYGISLLLLIIILIVKKQLHFNFSIFQLDKKFVREMVRYMVFIMAGSVGTVIVLQIDQLMVTGFLGARENGIYVIAFFMGTVIEIPKRSISQMSDAIIANAFENERIDEVKKIYKQSSINQLILGSLVFILVIINLENIYAIMPKGEAFEAGKLVVIIIGLSKLINMGFGVSAEIIISSKYYKTNIYFVLLLAALTIILNALLIPSMGLEGAALATLSSVFLFNLIKMIFIYRKLNFQPFSIHTLTTLFLTALTYLILTYLPTFDDPIVNGLYLSSLGALIFGGFILIFRPSREISNLITSTLNKFRS